jgi:TolB-like protein
VNKPILPVKETRAEAPSIAVLPFDNMSDDPEQGYFGDGISEDLIIDLSKIPDFLVITRLSSFTYKGKSVKIQQIVEELAETYLFGLQFGIHRKLAISPRLAFMRGTNYLRTAMKNPSNIAYRNAARVYALQRQHRKGP